MYMKRIADCMIFTKHIIHESSSPDASCEDPVHNREGPHCGRIIKGKQRRSVNRSGYTPLRITANII